MKKSFLVLVTALTLGLAACGNNPAPSGPVTPDLPVAEGKVTFWFEMADNEAAVAIPDYCNVFLTGAFFGKTDWPTKADEVVTMQRLEEGSNIFYGQWEGDGTAVEDKGYQLTVGYSAASGAPATGVNWSYKSVECQAGSGESGMDNLQFELSADGKTASLGSHHWEDVPGPVVKVQNIDVSITLATAAPEWVTLYAPGNYRNNWACSSTLDAMTPNADRTVWTIHIDEQILGTYEMKVIAEYTGASWSWKHAVLDNGEGGNFSLNILRANANSTIDLNERANDGQPFAFDWSVLPDPATIPAVELTFTVNFATALDDTKYPSWYVIGSHNSWAADDDHKFVIAADKKSMTLTIEVGGMLSFEYGICANSSWNPCFKAIDDPATGTTKNFTCELPDQAWGYTFEVSAEIMAVLNETGGEHGLALPTGAAKNAA